MEAKAHIRDHYYRLRRRKGIVFSCLFLALLVAGLYSFTMKPVYEATSSIYIEDERQQSPLTGERTAFENQFSQFLSMKTHFEMITSRPVLEKVLEKVNIKRESLKKGLVEQYLDTAKQNLKKAVNSLVVTFMASTPKQPAVSEEERSQAGKVEALARKIHIDRLSNTRLLSVLVEDTDPRASYELANAVAETYILYDSEVRLANSRTIMNWLNNQLYEMRKNVEKAEREFSAFKEKENLYSIEGVRKVGAQKIEEMNTSYLQTRSQRMEVEAKIEELQKYIQRSRGESVENIPAFLKSQVLETLFGDLLKAEVSYRKLRGVYKEKHPEIIKLTSEIQGLKSKIVQQIQKSLDNARAERAVLLAREKALEDARDRYEGDAIKTNRKEMEYSILEREVDSSREIYNTLLSRIKETNVLGGITSTNLRLAVRATMPVRPARPNLPFNMLIGLLVGVFAGLGLALLLEYLDQTVHNREEVEKELSLSVLSEIPLEKDGRRLPSQGGYISPNVLEMPMNSHFTESFRVLATGLRFSRLNSERGVYLLTSASPSEGKSTTAFNLGLTMALQGMRTVLVEADLRLPTSRKVKGLGDRPGVADILTGTFSTEIGEGQLGELTVGDIQRLIEIQEKTGVARFWNDEHTFSVSFLRGDIIDVDWPTRPPEERLGTLLVRSGLITREQASVALSKQKSTSGRLGQVLVHLGFLSVEALAGPLKLQMQENLKALYSCENAHYSFSEKEFRLATAHSDAKEAALLEAIGRIDNAGGPARTPYLTKQVKDHLLQISGQQMWVLTAGRVLPNPSAMLSSGRMRVLVEMLREEFDVILVDSPPAAAISDPAALAQFCDGVILVVRFGVTDMNEVKRAQEQLTTVQAPIVGMVLNGLEIKKEPYYYSRYYHKYHDYYVKSGKTSRRAKAAAKKSAADSKVSESG